MVKHLVTRSLYRMPPKCILHFPWYAVSTVHIWLSQYSNLYSICSICYTLHYSIVKRKFSNVYMYFRLTYAAHVYFYFAQRPLAGLLGLRKFQSFRGTYSIQYSIWTPKISKTVRMGGGRGVLLHTVRGWRTPYFHVSSPIESK